MYQGMYTQKEDEQKEKAFAATEISAEETEMIPTAQSQNTVDGIALKNKRSSRAGKPKASRGTRLFYGIYFSVTILLLAAILVLMIPLRNWLVRYEASQPEQMRDAVYAQLFDNPDWAALYSMAGKEDTTFVNKDIYAQYMDAKVGDEKLSVVETAAGLSKARKYLVKLGDEKVAAFTLTGGSEKESEIVNWQLGEVDLFFESNLSCVIQVHPSYTVTVNGVKLDESYTIRTVSTKAEDYLPDGLHGYQMKQLQINGLLAKPEITVLDAAGKPVALTEDAETGMLLAQLPAPAEMTAEEKAVAIAAAKANALFSIREISAAQLRQHFDAESQCYVDICETTAFLQSKNGYGFKESVTAVTDFYRYSDTLFSARVVLQLDVERTNGTIKEFAMDTTYFFAMKGGKYLVNNMTNVHIQEIQEQVRLTFLADGTVLDTMMVDAGAKSLVPPAVTVPEGKTFAGWAVQTRDDNGKVIMTIILGPEADGSAPVSTDRKLVPMELYAMFH